MAQLERVGPTHFEPIYNRLLHAHDPSISRDRWRRIFDYAWRRNEDHVGYALFESGEPVSFLGLIYSRIWVHGVEHKLCNTTTWVADESHRAQAASLVLPLRYLHDYTITNLSSNERAHDVFRAAGFRELESTFQLVPLVAPLRSRARRGVEVVVDAQEIDHSVTTYERRIIKDHEALARAMLVRDGEASCLLVYTRRPSSRPARLRVHYVSDPVCLVRNLGNVAAELHARERVWLCEIDQRLLGKARPGRSITRRLNLPRLYRSTRLRPEQIPSIYSELVLLGF